MGTFTEKHTAALEFLVSRFGVHSFAMKSAESYMHRSILNDLVESGILESRDGKSYKINYQHYLKTYAGRRNESAKKVDGHQ